MDSFWPIAVFFPGGLFMPFSGAREIRNNPFQCLPFPTICEKSLRRVMSYYKVWWNWDWISCFLMAKVHCSAREMENR
jgi:hypothetical protein